jgi:hypothetical protein
MEGDGRFSDQLEGWLAGEGEKTWGDLGEVFGPRSFAVAVMLLMIPAALPLPTGGVTHVLELIAILLAAELLIGRRAIWLPRSWQARSLATSFTGKAVPTMLRWIRWLERFSRPRGQALLRRGLVLRLLALFLVAFCLAAALAPPFSGLDTLPALGAVLICLALILDDVAIVLAGLVAGLVGITLIIVLGGALYHLVAGWL